MRIALLLPILILISCNRQENNKNAIPQFTPTTYLDSLPEPERIDSTKPAKAVYTSTDSIEDYKINYATYYAVVADTGREYYPLLKLTLKISKKTRGKIDSMGRSYNNNTAKDLIALPDDDLDEMYAGGYYPRRSPGTELSLEYYNYFAQNADDKTIAIIAGIYENKISADSALQLLKKDFSKAFVLKSEIYIGCMH
jgi:hypothetical protein